MSKLVLQNLSMVPGATPYPRVGESGRSQCPALLSGHKAVGDAVGLTEHRRQRVLSAHRRGPNMSAHGRDPHTSAHGRGNQRGAPMEGATRD